MKRKFISIIILSTLLVMQLGSYNMLENSMFDRITEPNEKPDLGSNPVIMKSIGAGGEEQVKANIISNGDFEETDQFGGPEEFYYDADTDREIVNNYADRVYAGFYSGLLKTIGSSSQTSSASMNRYLNSPYPYLDQNLAFSTRYYIVTNPDILTGGNVYIYISAFDSSTSYWYYMYYYLSVGNVIYMVSNSTNRVSFNLNSSLGQWNQLSQSVTNDFTAAFGAPTTTTSIRYVYYYCYSPMNPTGHTEYVIDDASLTDISTTEFLPNGDFEDGVGGYWSGQSSGPCSIEQTDDHVEGSKAINMTSVAKYDTGQGYSYLEYYFGEDNPTRGYYATEVGDFVVDIDWKYTDTQNGGSNQYAYVGIYADNDTFSAWIYIFFGYINDIIGWGNWSDASSSQIVIPAPGFGSRGTWEHLTFDMYKYYESMNLTNLAISDIWFEASAGSYANSTVEFLLDDLRATTYITGDPGFEQDWYSTPSDPIIGWRNGDPSPYVQHTSDAHSGNYAASVHSYGSYGTVNVFRSVQNIEISDILYTDFWWKLNTLTSGSGGQAFSSILFLFEGDFYLNYILGADNVLLTNDSNNVYYNVDNVGTTGTWFNLVRNLKTDLEAYFGPHIWNMTDISLRSFATGSGAEASVLFDDIHFVEDTTGPKIHSVILQNTPMYYEPVYVELNITDTIGVIQDVDVYYQSGVGWDYVSAVFTGGVYIATIPAADYGDTIQFYIMASDMSNNLVVDDNGGLYYSFFVDDDVDPMISFYSPINESTVSNDVPIVLDVGDLGSGVAYVEVYDGAVLLQNITAQPFEFIWDSRIASNGTHTITGIVYDNAGNSAISKILVDVQNDHLGPALSTPYINPTSPEYFDEVHVYISVLDQSVVDNVLLYYRIGGAGWETTPMVADGVLYEGLIPAADWDELVRYFITATDIHDQETSAGSLSVPFDYTVLDTVDPTLILDMPATSEILSGTIIIDMLGEGPGSGISSFEITLDEGTAEDEIVYNEIIFPASFEWNTAELEDGEHNIFFSLADNAGNVVEYRYVYTIKNRGPAAQGFIDFFQHWGALVGAVIGGAGIGAFYFFRWRKGRVS